MEPSAEQPKRREGKETVDSVELTPREVADLMFWSFRYTQNNSAYQSYFFHYCAVKHPHWRISEDPQKRQECRDAALKRIYEFFESGAHKDLRGKVTYTPDSPRPPDGTREPITPELKRVIDAQTDVEFSRLCMALNEKKSMASVEDYGAITLENQTFLEATLALLIMADQINAKDRAIGKRAPITSGAHAVKRLFITYILEKKLAAGPQVIEELMSDLRKTFDHAKRGSRKDSYILTQARKLAEAHNAENPDKPVVIDW